LNGKKPLHFYTVAFESFSTILLFIEALAVFLTERWVNLAELRGETSGNLLAANNLNFNLDKISNNTTINRNLDEQVVSRDCFCCQ
jgi:hypothetical protein